ncbi:DEAD/DEAH box helicase, partial [Enterococcus durans]
EDWIAKSVCFSDACKEKVINESLKILAEKRHNTTVPHKIIAAAPNIEEAKKIANMYNQREGIVAVAVHNELDKNEREKIFVDVENNRIDVIVNVNMMGEGYDHKYLSVAAIFRVFKNILPYEQFIGRILRAIPEDEVRKPDDNIGTVVVHQNLNLDGLWEYYRQQLEEWKFIEEISNEIDSGDPGQNNSDKDDNLVELNYGSVKEIGVGSLSHEIYMKTEYIKEKEEYEANRNEKIEQLLKIMPHMTRKEASIIYDSQESSDLLLNRPDKLIRQRQETTDKNIRYQIVPMLLAKHKLSYEGKEVAKLSVFTDRRYSWILKQKNNAAYLAIYFNQYLANQIGLKRAEWSNSDFEKASKLLVAQVDYIDDLMKEL